MATDPDLSFILSDRVVLNVFDKILQNRTVLLKDLVVDVDGNVTTEQVEDAVKTLEAADLIRERQADISDFNSYYVTAQGLMAGRQLTAAPLGLRFATNVAAPLSALAVTVVVSVVFAAIEVPRRSKAELAACVTAPALIYTFLLTIANIATTVLAAPIAARLLPVSSPYFFFISAVVGTFGFESVLRQTNVTVHGNGVLAIKEWLDRSLDQAAAAAIQKQEDAKQELDGKLRAKLLQLPDDEINTMILARLGPGEVAKLDEAAKASGANVKLYKVMRLITVLKPSEARALLKRNQPTS